MNDSSVVNVAVIGIGRMGRHHARTYASMPGARLLAVVDGNEDRAGAVADDYDADACLSIEELLEKHPGVQAVSVAVPTIHHVDVATPLLERGIACLVEKPLAPTAEAARMLADLARGKGAVLQVGHTERFNPAVRAVANMGMTPRFMEVIRVSPMTFRSLDVGVVMDMMIHDLDIVLSLARSPLERVDAAGVKVLGQAEDVANARLVFQSGCVANLTASRLAMKTERKLRFFSESAYVSLDYQTRSGMVLSMSDNADVLAKIRERLGAGEDLSSLDYSDLVHIHQLTMEAPPGEEDPLTAELANFLRAVRQEAPPEVDGDAGSAAVDAAQRVVQAINEHRWEGLPENRP